MLAHEDEAIRASSARVLGLIGETDPLRRAFGSPRHPFWVRCAIAGALARNGVKDALREVAPHVCCESALAQISLACGRTFATREELETWLRE